jgi:hypothetical protein
MKFVRIAAMTVLLMLAGGSGWHTARAQGAPDADAMQAARDLVAVVSKDAINQMVDRITAQVWPPIEHSLKAKQDITPDQLADLRREFVRIQVDFVTKVMADAPAIYARHFTAAELHQLLAFYRTPVGAKALRVMPQITAEAVQLVLSKLPQLQQDTMAAFIKVLKERGFAI